MAKKDVNRLKIMLAVTKRSNKWLAEMFVFKNLVLTLHL